MCSNMLGTTLATKAWTPQKFLQVGTSVNNSKHERKKSPTPHEENDPQKDLPHGGKGPMQ